MRATRGAGRAPGVGPTGPPLHDAVTWHDVECTAYAADFPLWRELAAERVPARVLELGCGTGRVALDLAGRSCDVAALDSEPALVREAAARARRRGLRLETRVADARAFDLDGRFGLVIAPMQLVQLLGGRDGRRAMLACARRHLVEGGLLAAALADPLEGAPPEEARPPLPDVREVGGWVLSSLPVAMTREADGVRIDRLRHAVSPAGELSESMASIRLDALDPADLAAEAAELGFQPRAPRLVPATDAYVGSTVVMLEAA